jgi:hypothetical protein
MFGFLKRAARRREALKLRYQNHLASVSIASFDPALHREVIRPTPGVQANADAFRRTK